MTKKESIYEDKKGTKLRRQKSDVSTKIKKKGSNYKDKKNDVSTKQKSDQQERELNKINHHIKYNAGNDLYLCST